MRIEMPYEVEWIIRKIREHGFEAFAVGGCVRDTLLLRTPEDWDITTSAKPEDVKGIFPKTVDTGIEHGTVTVIKNRHGYEVTTYRIDGEYRDGRHPDSVEFTSNLKEDLKRRDFTINAMAYSHETGIVDAFGGMEDLKAKVIRCVGNPMDRFTEDALRILRAIRFAAQLDFEIEDETYRAVAEIAPNLLKVSKERVQVELTKLLLSDHPEKISMVKETGISSYVADGFDRVFEQSAAENMEYDAYRSIAGLPREKSMRWAGFLRRMEPKEARKILKALKLDNETVDNVTAMAAEAKAAPEPDKVQIRKALSRMTKYQFEGALALMELGSAGNTAENRDAAQDSAEDRDATGRQDAAAPRSLKGDVELIRGLLREIEADGDCVSLKELAVNGKDLMDAGMKQGKEMGETLKYLLDLVLEDPALNRKEILLGKIKETEYQPAI